MCNMNSLMERFPKKYTRYIVDRKKGNCTLKIIKSELNDYGFSESNEEEYNRDILGKKSEFGNSLTEE